MSPVFRFRYPKTSVHLPAEGLPIRFRSILSTYTWPKQFLSVIAHEYGEQWLINRLKTWKWSMSTAFSGVGAAENVTCLLQTECNIVFYCVHH